MKCPKCGGTGEINILYHSETWFTFFGWRFGPTTYNYLPEPCFYPGCHKGQIDWDAYAENRRAVAMSNPLKQTA